MERKKKVYKKECHKPTGPKRKSKMRIDQLKTKSQQIHIREETYQSEMGDYITKLGNHCKNEEKYPDPPRIELLLYASKFNMRKDLEYLNSINVLNERLLIKLFRHAIIRNQQDLAVWFFQNMRKDRKLEIRFRGTPLLHTVVSKGFFDVLTELLQNQSVDIHATDFYGETALSLALQKYSENPTVCRILLKHGAKTDILDQKGLFPLHRVSRDSNNTSMIDLLLEFGADIEAKDHHGKRPLDYAFERKFNKQIVVCHLIKQGAKVGATFESNRTIRCKLTVPAEQILTMTKPILRELRTRSSKANKNDISVLDCVDLTGDVGALVDLLKEDGNISTLCKSSKEVTVKRLLKYVELTGSHRLLRCLQERRLSKVDRRQFNFAKQTVPKSPVYKNPLPRKVEGTQDAPDIYELGQSDLRVIVLHFEAVEEHGFLLARGGDEMTDRSQVDLDFIETVVVISPFEDKKSVHKVFTLAALHLMNQAPDIPGKHPLKFTHIPTSSYLADTSLPHRIRSGQTFSTLRWKNPYVTDHHQLHAKVLNKQKDLLQGMLTQPAEEVNAADGAGWTALNLAILLGETETVTMLLDHGAYARSVAYDLPAFADTDWERNSGMVLSPFILSVCLNLKEITQILCERNLGNPYMDICIKLSYGMTTESTLLESVCREAEKIHQDIEAQFKSTYTVHNDQPIERVCLGFSENVDDIEKKKDIHGVKVVIINPDISPESSWEENTEMTVDEESLCKSIIDLWADELWDQHPNLNAITAGSITNVKTTEVKPTGYILLHCSHKGYIPHTSISFPAELKSENGTMPVAVLEGEFRLSPLPFVSDSCSKCPGQSHKEISDFSQDVSEETPPDDLGNSGSSTDASSVALIDDNSKQHTATTCVCGASALSKQESKRHQMKTDEHISLKSGMHLCNLNYAFNIAYEGTVGAFVDMGNEKTGFITCAHLFYRQEISDGNQPIHFKCLQQGCGADVITPFDHFSEEVIRGVSDMQINDEPVCETYGEENGRNVYWESGKVVHAVFDPSLETGIDAAVVEIDQNRAPCDGSFDKINPIHLQNSKMDRKHPPTFTSGRQADRAYLDSVASSERPIRCMKLGAGSGLSVGILTWKHGQIKLPDSPRLGIERDSLQKYIMKGQYVISEYNRKQFFECGDSGSAVFVMRKDRQYYYPDACLGIAIGFLDKKTFVTPIGSILDQLKTDKMPELTLKKFK